MRSGSTGARSSGAASRKADVSSARQIASHNREEVPMLARALLVVLVALTLAACSGGRGYTRGIFHGMVVDKTEQEVIDKVGKPTAIEKMGDGVRYTYTKKTFDPDNLNQVDDRTFVDFEQRNGKLIAVDVSFG
jgi:hypothetical protein